MNASIIQRVRRDSPPLPADLLNIDPEEYAKMLRVGGYSEHLIVKELERLALFQDKFKPPAVLKFMPEIVDAEDTLVKVANRRHSRGRRRPGSYDT